jgi:hypothetical protein
MRQVAQRYSENQWKSLGLNFSLPKPELGSVHYTSLTIPILDCRSVNFHCGVPKTSFIPWKGKYSCLDVPGPTLMLLWQEL